MGIFEVQGAYIGASHHRRVFGACTGTHCGSLGEQNPQGDHITTPRDYFHGCDVTYHYDVTAVLNGPMDPKNAISIDFYVQNDLE